MVFGSHNAALRCGSETYWSMGPVGIKNVACSNSLQELITMSSGPYFTPQCPSAQRGTHHMLHLRC